MYSVCYSYKLFNTSIMSDRDAILIGCLKEDATQIRERAKLDRRNVSSYALSIVMRCVEFEERLFQKLSRFDELNRAIARRAILRTGPKTTLMIRCSKEDAKRIRTAAGRRQMSISAFVRQCLRRSWSVSDAHMKRPIERGGQLIKWNWTALKR